MNNKKNVLELIIKAILILICIIGIVFTLTYIFYTSTAILTADSVITDVLAHHQLMDKQLLLTNWYYGNEFWIFSLSIPTFILSFFIKNNLLLRQVSVLITAVIFFYLLYQYGKKFLGKKPTFILITIFLTGISYSILDYFYAFNAYLTVCINSLFLLLLYYNMIEEKEDSRVYFFLSILFTFLFNATSLRYFPSVTFPFIISELIIIIVRNKTIKIKTLIKTNAKKIVKVNIILISAVLGLSMFTLLTNVYHYEQRAGSILSKKATIRRIKKKTIAVVNCVDNFFGYDNENNAITFMTGNQYFVRNKKDYPKLSFFTFTNVVKVGMCIICMIISPIVLLKNYKKNDSKLNFLLLFNITSFITMIAVYMYSNSFFYNRSELKYYIFNMIIFIMTSLYFLYNYVSKNKILSYIVDSFIIVYMISNLYTTYLTIRDNGKKVQKEKYELVNLLKRNNLKYGYGGTWNSLISYYLSDYKITVAPVAVYPNYIFPYKWYSDKRWYEDTEKHRGKVFLILDERDLVYRSNIINYYGLPNDVLSCKGYEVLIYDKNPFIKTFHNKN